MCEVRWEVKQVVKRVNNINQYSDLIAVSPIQIPEPGHCPICGVAVPYEYSHPTSACSRPLCESCYQHAIGRSDKSKCIICGELLPQIQYEAQFRNPREITNGIHQGRCLDYYVIMAARALSEPCVAHLFAQQVNSPVYGGTLQSQSPRIIYNAQPDLRDLFNTFDNELIKIKRH